MTNELPNLWRGDLVLLRAAEPEDWQRFWADQDTDAQRSGWMVHWPQSADAQKKSVTERANQPQDGSRIFLAIETLDTGALAGSLTIHRIDERNGAFEYGLGIFREFWGRGYGPDGIRIALRYMFSERRFEKVNATVYSFNDKSLAMHRKLGFVEEGVIRSNLFMNGRRYDEHWFGMTRAEFFERYGASATLSGSGESPRR